MSEKPTPTRTTIPPKYLSDFSKALASEVQILLREVLVLGDERRALQYEVEKYKAAKAKIVAENKPKAEDFKAEPAWRVVELSPEKRKQFEKLKPKATTEVPQATGTANTSENANGTIVPSTSKAALKPDFPSWIPWKPLRQKGTPPKSLPAPESTPLLQGPPPQAPSPPAESPPPPLPAPKPVRAPMRSDSWATWQPDPKFAPTPPPPESPPPALRAPRSVRAEPVRSDSWATWRPDPNLAPTPPPPESSLPTGLFGPPSPPTQPTKDEPATEPARVKFSTPPQVSSPGLFVPRSTRDGVPEAGTEAPIQQDLGADQPAPQVRDLADAVTSDARNEEVQNPPPHPRPVSSSPRPPPPPAPGPIETAPSWASWQPNPAFAPTPPPGDLEPVLELHEQPASQSGRSNEEHEEVNPQDGAPVVTEPPASDPPPPPDAPQGSALGLSGLGNPTDSQQI